MPSRRGRLHWTGWPEDTAERRAQAASQGLGEADLARIRALLEAEARRPREARLLEACCTKCHSLEQVAAARHTPIGWWFTVVRMRWWNGAAMEGDEAAVLTAHLAQSQPARGGARLAEYGLAVLAVTVVPGAVLLHRLRRRRQRGHYRAGGPVGLMAGCVLATTLLLSPPRAAAADTTTSGQPAGQASGESVPQPQEAPTKNTASDAAKADAPTERRSPSTDEKPSEPPSIGLCSGQ